MDENVIDFEEYNIKVDLTEIEKMDKEEMESCKGKIEEIKEMLNKKQKGKLKGMRLEDLVVDDEEIIVEEEKKIKEKRKENEAREK